MLVFISFIDSSVVLLVELRCHWMELMKYDFTLSKLK